MDANGAVVSADGSSGTMQYDGKELGYTVKQSVLFENNDQKVDVVYAKGSLKEDMLIFVLPPTLQKVLLDTWQSTWPKLLKIRKLRPGEDIQVVAILKKSQFMALIRLLAMRL